MTVQEFEALPEPKKQAAYLDFLRYENVALKKDIEKLHAKIAELEQDLQKSREKEAGV
ncbi:hypothetical protein [uncultured Aliiroseovarius sp.]|uniref:hypothetical protein n=1 Tax=uncultured Aliiroseovarius sp. TaxID=1658783 RepID=UPI0025996575|nr:hypothetical protein [uncultured Aliiroseovarius sp.]